MREVFGTVLQVAAVVVVGWLVWGRWRHYQAGVEARGDAEERPDDPEESDGPSDQQD